jgi:hypothetical protein
MPGSSKWSLSIRIPHQSPVGICPVPHTCYMPQPSFSFSAMSRRINVNILGCFQILLLDTFTGRIYYFFVLHMITTTDLLYSSPVPHPSTFQYISDLLS